MATSLSPGRSETVPPGAARPTTRARVVVLVTSLVCAWVLLRTGPGLVPGIEGQEAGARIWPNAPVTDQTSYILRLPLGQLLYRELPVQGLQVYVWMHVGALLLTGLLLLAWMLRRFGSQTGAVATVVLILSPLTTVLLEWVGLYDAFSVLVWALVILTLRRAPALQFLVAVVAGVQNFEQVAVGIVLLALLPELVRSVGWRPSPVALLSGAVLGRVALEAYLRSVGVPGGSRLDFMLANPELTFQMMRSFWLNLPLVVATVLGGIWAFALVPLRDHWHNGSRARRLRLLAVVVILLAIGTAGADHTRVIVLSSMPLLVAGAVAIARTSPTFTAFWRRPEAWLLLLFPPVVSFGDIVLPLGVPHSGWGPF